MGCKKVTYDVNQTEFISKFQKEAWRLGKSVLPLETTLPGIKDEETREGCEQIFRFTHEVIADMYNDSAKYDNDKPPKRYLTYNLDLLMKLSGVRLSGDALYWIVPSSDAYKKSGIKWLEPFGFVYKMIDGEHAVANDKYPLFIKYWDKMYRLGPKGNAIRLYYLWTCDFRLFSKAKKFTTADYLRMLPDRNKPFFMELNDYVLKKGAKRDVFSYKYKNQHLLGIDQMGYFTIPCQGYFNEIVDEAKAQPDADALLEYIRNELRRCNGCNPKCGGGGVRKIDVNGQQIPSCVGGGIILGKMKENPFYDERDIMMLKRIMDIKANLIDMKCK